MQSRACDSISTGPTISTVWPQRFTAVRSAKTFFCSGERILIGRSVAIVDARPAPGGACVHTGTLPSKTLREAALNVDGENAFVDADGRFVRGDAVGFVEGEVIAWGGAGSLALHAPRSFIAGTVGAFILLLFYRILSNSYIIEAADGAVPSSGGTTVTYYSRRRRRKAA